MSKKLLRISLRASNMPSSPIRKFVPLLEKVKKRGIKVYEIHIGQTDLKTPEEILKRITGFKGKRLIYTASPGIDDLRSAWRDYFRAFNISFQTSDIVATIGGSEAILFSFLSVCDPGEEIIVFEPFYTTYNGYAAMAAVKLRPVTCFPKKDFHLPPRKEIEGKITKKTKAVLLCNPNNPTGTVYTRSEIEMLIDIAERRNLFIISDETYREFVYDGEKHYSVMNFVRAHERAVLLSSISKNLNACGARIGCLASKNQYIIKAAVKFSQSRLSLPMVEQEAVIPVLKKSRKYTHKIALEYQKRKDAVCEELGKIESVKFSKPRGAFYLIADLPVKNAEAFTEWMLTKFSVNKETVMVSPAEGFYATRGLGKRAIRIAFVLSAQKMRTAVKLLGQALEKYKMK